jgi:predicted transcriptional regulator
MDVRVKKKRFTDGQIAYALAQESTGQTIAEICRRLGVSERSDEEHVRARHLAGYHDADEILEVLD